MEKGGWAENPIDRAQLTYLNLSVWALSKLIKSYSPTAVILEERVWKYRGCLFLEDLSCPEMLGFFPAFQINIRSHFPIVCLLPRRGNISDVGTL